MWKKKERKWIRMVAVGFEETKRTREKKGGVTGTTCVIRIRARIFNPLLVLPVLKFLLLSVVVNTVISDIVLVYITLYR